MQKAVISVQRCPNYHLDVILGAESKYTAKIVIQLFVSMATNNFLSTLGDFGVPIFIIL